MAMPVDGQEAFRTHHNYICSLKHLLSGAKLSHTDIGRIPRAPIPLLNSKKNLIALTAKSLDDERKIVVKDQDYSYASTSWLPVKTYYLLFNALMTIDYLFTLDPGSFRIGHGRCSEKFTKRLVAGEITFDNAKLNRIYDQKIFSHHEPPGANLRPATVLDQHAMLAMKKIAQYKLEEWKRLKRIPNFTAKKHRDEKQAFLRAFQLSIFEFPYHMRLRANYRDFAFIEGVSSAETALYFKDYFAFAGHFYRALKGLRDQLVKARMN
jgi:hypothetical protein